MADIKGLLADPEFNQLGTTEQQQVLSSFDPDFAKLSPGTFLRTLGEMQKKIKVPFKSSGSLSKDMGNIMPDIQAEAERQGITNFGGYKGTETPEWQRLAGAATGIPGGPVGMGMGYAMPPRSIGEGAATLGGGAMLGKIPAMLPKTLGPMEKILMQALAGGAGTEAMHLGTEGINQLANKTGVQNAPSQGLMAGLLPMLLGTLGPATLQMFLNRTATQAPSTTTARLRSLLPGVPVDPSKVGEIQTLNPAQSFEPSFNASQTGNPKPLMADFQRQIDLSKLEQTRIKAKTAEEILKETESLRNASAKKQVEDLGYSQRLAENEAGQQQMKAELAQNAVEQAKIRKDLTRAQAKAATYPNPPQYYEDQSNKLSALQLKEQNLRAKMIQQRATDMRGAGQNIEAQQTQANLSQPQSEMDLIKARGNASVAKQSNYQAGLQQDIDKLQSGAEQYEQVHPGVNRLAWTPPKGSGRIIPTVDDILNNVASTETSPAEIAGLRSHLANQGQSHVENFEKAMTEKFFQQAWDIKTETMANAPALLGSDAAFSPTRLSAMLGVEPTSPKVAKFIKGVQDISDLKAGTLTGFAKQAGSHAAWVLGTSLVLPGSLGPKAAAIGTSALISIAWPKIMDKMLRDPQFGKNFHDWATSTDRSARSLANWPTLATKLNDMAVPADSTTLQQIQGMVERAGQPQQPPPMPTPQGPPQQQAVPQQ